MTLHKLRVETECTLRLIYTDLEQLGIEKSLYQTTNYKQTQEIGEAVEFLGYDGLIVPSARWNCEHLVIFPNQLSSIGFRLIILEKIVVDWKVWAEKNKHDIDFLFS